ncbi:MAG TPA: protein-glutamate O-methyltransferase CheR [Polyangiales bacterium]|nr:protein-glutamate O-methyltransferase CheR [Polyangiales bacterium]
MPWSDPALQNVAELVAQRLGIVTTRSPVDLERAAREVVARSGLRDIAELAQRLAAGALWQELIDQITVGETYFFRNPEQFAFITDTVLPAIVERRGSNHPLRVWSAGCASGEEAYSLAITLDRAGKLETASVLGTDLSQTALERARTGRYREWSFRACDPQLLPLYFRQERSERVISDALRAHVQFAKLNLLDLSTPEASAAIGTFDLILCRNVLIYLDPDSIARCERGLFERLAPGGWLIGGPSDPPLGQHSPLEIVVFPNGVCYRRPVDVPLAIQQPALEPQRLAAEPTALGSVAPYRRLARRTDAEGPQTHARAQTAFDRADYTEVIEIARRRPSDLRLCMLGARAHWNQSGAAEAERACTHALRKHGLSAELHYLHAITLVDCRRLHDALRAVRRSLYLDRSLTMAHFAHASILERLHDLEGARRAYRNTFDACTSKHSPDEELPLGDGIVAQGLANAAAHALSELAKRCPA